MQLRPAEPADAAAVARLYLRARQELLPYAPLAHSDEEVRAWVAEHLLPGSLVTLAERDGRLAGFIASSVQQGEAPCLWIDQLYLQPELVGQGIGSALLRPLLAQEIKLPIRLYCFQANSGARRFYERFGFEARVFSDGEGNEERCPDVLYERGCPAS